MTQECRYVTVSEPKSYHKFDLRIFVNRAPAPRSLKHKKTWKRAVRSIERL